ncbi:MAG: hypothetical protein ACKPB7_29230 [Sphaerospermopsis kisseleviana]
MRYLLREASEIVESFRKINSFQDFADLLEVDYFWFKQELFAVPLEEKYTVLASVLWRINRKVPV